MNRPITNFIKHHYRHFNAATLVDAAQAYVEQLEAGNKICLLYTSPSPRDATLSRMPSSA